MNPEEKSDEEIIIEANPTDVEALVDDLPSVEESDLKPSLASPGEPAPFDPFSALDAAEASDIENPIAREKVSGTIEVTDAIDKASEEVSEKNDAPTPESIAAELKEVAEKAEVVDDETEQEEQKELEATKEPTPSDSEKTTKKKSGLSIFIIIVLLVLIVVAAVCAVLFFMKKPEADKAEQKPASASKAEPKEKTYDYLAGAWESQAEGGSCYVFSPDETFYWLRDCEDFDDNYYYGKVSSVERGKKVLSEIKMNLDSVKQMLQIKEDAISEDDIFLAKLSASERKVGGVDTSANLGKDYIQLLFVRSSNTEMAYGYQFNSGDMYVFGLNPEISAPKRNVAE